MLEREGEGREERGGWMGVCERERGLFSSSIFRINAFRKEAPVFVDFGSAILAR